MTQPIIRKASRKKAKLRLGLSAPSGAGKTMGALLLAYGITGDWDKIGLIDTEEGSGELYVGTHKQGVTIGEFQYIRISGGFAPVKYTDAIHAFEAAGVDIIIIDSLTHAWAGAEGLLEKQGKVADRTKNSYTAWREVTPDHNALVNAMLQSPCHIIATMRSKVEYALQQGVNGKQQVVKMGMAPVQREGMEFEFTVFLDISSSSVATASKDRTDLFSTVNAAGTLEKREFIITPAIGNELLNWLQTGKESIDSIAATLAAEINASSNVQKTYNDNIESFNRIKLERPDWWPMMVNLMDKRAVELS